MLYTYSGDYGFRPKDQAPYGHTEPLWRQYRDEFPVTQNLIYLNHAAVAPLPRRSAAAMQALAEDALQFGSLHYDRWLDAYEGLRVAAARLIGANRGEIALIKNTSEGISTVAQGLDWRPGDRIVAFREEFPSNYYPWLRLEAQRCYVEWLSVDDPLEKIDMACTGAKLLAISFVQYLSGFRADLNAIGEICKRRNCFFFVDAIQGLGAFPLDVESRAHRCAWPPTGTNGCWVRKDAGFCTFGNPARIPSFPRSSAGPMWRATTTMRRATWRCGQDAGRYECGTLNTIGCYGLRASIELLLEAGVERIAPAVQALADQLATGAVGQRLSITGRSHARKRRRDHRHSEAGHRQPQSGA